MTWPRLKAAQNHKIGVVQKIRPANQPTVGTFRSFKILPGEETSRIRINFLWGKIMSPGFSQSDFTLSQQHNAKPYARFKDFFFAESWTLCVDTLPKTRSYTSVFTGFSPLKPETVCFKQIFTPTRSATGSSCTAWFDCDWLARWREGADLFAVCFFPYLGSVGTPGWVNKISCNCELNFTTNFVTFGSSSKASCQHVTPNCRWLSWQHLRINILSFLLKGTPT